MSELLEIEFKNSLSYDEYEKIVKHFKPNPESLLKQINIYFDTNNLQLQENKMALRTRLVDDRIELTLKQHAAIGLLETTDIITKEDLDQLITNQILVVGDVSKKLAELQITNSLYEIASLTTYRYEFHYLDNLIALDKSIYYNHIDYEIELETKEYEYGKKVFFELLESFQIPKKEIKSKIFRAYSYKNSNKIDPIID